LPFKPRHLDFSVNPFRGLAFELPHHQAHFTTG
jgi:hypothetical protein